MEGNFDFRTFRVQLSIPFDEKTSQKYCIHVASTDCQYSNLGIRKLTWSVSVMKNLVPRKTWAACKTYLLLVTLAFFPERSQGQARGYGRITHFLPLPLRGHHFQRATVTQWLDRFQIPGYQMKDMYIVFPLIPNGLL